MNNGYRIEEQRNISLIFWWKNVKIDRRNTALKKCCTLSGKNICCEKIVIIHLKYCKQSKEQIHDTVQPHEPSCKSNLEFNR